MSEKYWLAIVVVGGGFVYGAACLYLYLTQHRKVFLVPKTGKETPVDWGLAYEPVTIDNHGKPLQAWWIPGLKDRPVVLFCHGNGVTMHHLSKHVLFLRPLGIGIFLFDYQGYGDSEGKAGEANSCADAALVWQYLVTQRGIKGENILIYGHSLGGGVATWLAARHRCGGVILEGTFTSIPDLATDYYPWLPVRKLARIDFNNLANMKNIQAPLFITHSTEDEIIPFHHSEHLFANAPFPKQLWPIRGRHADAFVQTSTEGLGALRDFFKIGP
ncbi:MAG: hypothetical protein HW380_3349 [Magnetococcales bacterium]|nr:hypothetical protein [Magnetococcales bacterium]HIJ84262.1 alpha/beta fold hydrolase [Magnetococcales bacterium]